MDGRRYKEQIISRYAYELIQFKSSYNHFNLVYTKRISNQKVYILFIFSKITQKSSTIHLIDLAGSERVKKTGLVNSDRLKEAGSINTSLHVLGKVI